MRKFAFCALVILGACAHEDGVPNTPDAAVAVDATTDAVSHPDNGFGNSCSPMYNTQHLYTECQSLDGLTGVCALDSNGGYACRRFCTDTHWCPDGQSMVAGVEDICYCEPAP